MSTQELRDQLLYFISEREWIRIKKEHFNLPPPWTGDEVLQKYRFCNVCRADDRVSRWIIKNLLIPYQNSPDLWFIAACARYVNWPPTLAKLLQLGAVPDNVEAFDPELFGRCVDGIVASGEKAWTGAYLITARQLPPGEGKGHWIARCMLDPLKSVATDARAAVASGSLETLAKVLESSYGWGTFMAGQVVADLTYVAPMNKAKDLYTWAPIGPGSTRGLNRLHLRPLNQVIKEPQFLEELIDVRDMIIETLGFDDLTLHDNQSVMCEADKYFRLLAGGRVRANYAPETRFEP